MCNLPLFETTADEEIAQLKARVMELEEQLVMASDAQAELIKKAYRPKQYDREVAARALEDAIKQIRQEIRDQWIPTHAIPKAPIDDFDFGTTSARLEAIAAKLRAGGEKV